MKRYFKFAIAMAAILGIAGVASAQLAGTQRILDHYWFASDRCVKFGNIPNASVCYTGGNLVLDILAGGGKVSIPDGIDLGTGNLTTSTSVIFEGATADAFESTLTVVDPTADNTLSLPNASGTLLLSTAAQDAIGSVKGVANGFEFEGATADGFEATVSVIDPTADQTVTLPNQTGAVILSSGGVVDSANAISGGTGTLVFEGATANDFETTIMADDPTADRVLRFPDVGGTLLTINGAMSGGTVNNSIIGGTVPEAGTFTTLVATTSITSSAPGTLGWNLAAAANQACTTTCTSACVHGWDTAAGEVAVDCANATADKCLCAGAN